VTPAQSFFSCVSGNGEAQSYPVEPGSATIEATGAQECTISLNSPVLNPFSGLAVGFSSVFLQSTAWFEHMTYQVALLRCLSAQSQYAQLLTVYLLTPLVTHDCGH
jgi:hypothetical protein